MNTQNYNPNLARETIEENLLNCCIDLSTWNTTNLLPENSIVRQISDKYCGGKLSLAETLINEVARKKVIDFDIIKFFDERNKENDVVKETAKALVDNTVQNKVNQFCERIDAFIQSLEKEIDKQ